MYVMSASLIYELCPTADVADKVFPSTVMGHKSVRLMVWDAQFALVLQDRVSFQQKKSKFFLQLFFEIRG